EAVSTSSPGTLTVVGAVTETPALVPCSCRATFHEPPPPPASAIATERVPPLTGNVTDAGVAKRSGLSARGRSTSPPPSRSTETSRPAESRTGWAVWTSADLISATVQAGCRSFRSAAAPATCGLAMLVPPSCPHGPPCPDGREEVIATPGALTSGLSWSETGVGPADEKSAIVSDAVVAATVIADGALAGELIEPNPNSSKSLPAATTGTPPARPAPSGARTTGSRDGSPPGPRSEGLITSIPSATAASIAAAISAALPSRPKSGVGIESAL